MEWWSTVFSYVNTGTTKSQIRVRAMPMPRQGQPRRLLVLVLYQPIQPAVGSQQRYPKSVPPVAKVTHARGRQAGIPGGV